METTMRYISRILIALPFVFWGASVGAADADAGKATFEAKCAECHYEDDFAGEAEADILGMIQAVKSADHKGKEETAGLSADDEANLAAFWASFE